MMVTLATVPNTAGSSIRARTICTTKDTSWEPKRSIKRHIRLETTFCLLSIAQ